MTNRKDSYDVAVVGAGVVGAAAALGAAQAGLTVALIGPPPPVFTATTAVPYDARVYALAPASIQLLQRLRVWAAMESVNGASAVQAVERMEVFGDDGGRLDFDAYGAAVERLATIVEESTLARALAAGLSFAPGVTRVSAPLENVRFEHECAQLHIGNGATLTAALVVAADGARSAVRAAAGITTRDVSYDQTALVANFACSAPHRSTAWQWFTERGVIALLPLPPTSAVPNAVSLVWSAPQAAADTLRALTPQQLADAVLAATAAPLGTLTALGPVSTFPLRRLSVSALAAPRLVLVGDAAHVVHPLAGQGLNLGLQDVAAWLDVITTREPFRQLGDWTLLRRYARRRAEAVALMRVTTDGLARLFATDDPLARRLRNAGLAFVNRARPLKQTLIRRAIGE